jgi:hypothetical protein
LGALHLEAFTLEGEDAGGCVYVECFLEFAAGEYSCCLPDDVAY